MRYLLILSLLLCSGCASSLHVKYDTEGRIEQITGKGTQVSEITKGDMTVKMDNKTTVIPDRLINISGVSK